MGPGAPLPPDLSPILPPPYTLTVFFFFFKDTLTVLLLRATTSSKPSWIHCSLPLIRLVKLLW